MTETARTANGLSKGADIYWSAGEIRAEPRRTFSAFLAPGQGGPCLPPSLDLGQSRSGGSNRRTRRTSGLSSDLALPKAICRLQPCFALFAGAGGWTPPAGSPGLASILIVPQSLR